MERCHPITVALLLGLITAAGCASAGDPYKKHQRMTVESYGVPHTGYYDAHGLWHGGFYDDQRVYHADDPTWGKTHDPEWSAHFHGA